jgi:hypothetical protein
MKVPCAYVKIACALACAVTILLILELRQKNNTLTKMLWLSVTIAFLQSSVTFAALRANDDTEEK